MDSKLVNDFIFFFLEPTILGEHFFGRNVKTDVATAGDAFVNLLIRNTVPHVYTEFIERLESVRILVLRIRTTFDWIRIRPKGPDPAPDPAP